MRPKNQAFRGHTFNLIIFVKFKMFNDYFKDGKDSLEIGTEESDF